MNRRMIFMYTVAGLLGGSLPLARAATQQGTAFTFQGRLVKLGVPVTDTCEFQFRLWDASFNGNPVGPVLFFTGEGAVDVVDGLFTVTLDFGNVFGGDERWLEIRVRCPGDVSFIMLNPRRLLTSTPYALYALNTAGASLTLPYSDSFTGGGVGETAFGIAQDGLGYAANFAATDAGNYIGALGVSAVGQGPSLFVTNSGGGACARLQNVVQSNIFPTVHATTFGQAPAVLGDAGIGTDGTGVNGVGRGTGHGVRGSAEGTGFAGHFDGRGYFSGNVGINNEDPQWSLDVAGRIYAETSGWAVRGKKIGNGTFPGVWGETESPSSNASGVRGYVRGTAPGSGSAGVFGHNEGTSFQGYGVKGTHAGTGAGVFGNAYWGVSGVADDPAGYGGSFSGSGFLGSGQALIVWGEAHLLSTVGIGTTTIPSGARLAVDGKILCEEVEVQLSQDWPDYVFDDDYALTPLTELERHVKEEKHLPGVPSAGEVAENGVAVGEMQAKLLEKVEELTLYVIDLNKQLDEVKADNALLRERVRSLAVAVGEE